MFAFKYGLIDCMNCSNRLKGFDVVELHQKHGGFLIK